MAARNKLTHDAKTREKIKTTQLLNRLYNHVMTYPNKKNYDKHFMKASQVTAAVAVLRKTLPDLVNIEGNLEHDHTGEVNHTHEHTVKNALAENFNDWLKEKDDEPKPSTEIQH